jgi:hypothetical protein
MIYHRSLWQENQVPPSKWSTLRVTWAGARLYARYREATWDGSITISGGSKIVSIKPFGGVLDVLEEVISKTSDSEVIFSTHTSGNFDGANLTLSNPDSLLTSIKAQGNLGGYVKVGDALKGNPHKAQPKFVLKATWEEALVPGGKTVEIKGGADLFVKIEIVPDAPLLRRVERTWTLGGRIAGEERAVYFVGREWDGGKVITSPIFFKYE